MRDDFHEYSTDPAAQKSVTDWLMQVIARKEPTVLHDEAPTEKAHSGAESKAAIAVQEAPAAVPATTANGSNGTAPSQNGYAPATSLNGREPAVSSNGYSQNGHALTSPSQNGHAPSPIIDVFGDIFDPPSQNGHAPIDPMQNGHVFTADDLCGPPAFGPVPVVLREEISADDLCWVPKPEVTESYRNGNGHHEPFGAPIAEPVAEVPQAAELMEIAAPEIMPEPQIQIEAPASSNSGLAEAPVVVQEPFFAAVPDAAVPEAAVWESAVPDTAVPDAYEPYEPLRAPDVAEPQALEAASGVAEEDVAQQAAISPTEWHQKMMAMAGVGAEPQVIEPQSRVFGDTTSMATPAEIVPVAEAVAAYEPQLIAPEAPTIEAAVEVPVQEPQVIDATASELNEPVVAPAESAAVAETAAGAEAQAQTAEQASATTPAAGEQNTNLVAVERRKRKRPAVSIADICRDWVIDEMQANGGIPEPQEIEEEDDFLPEDSIVQSPESVFAHEGIWGNTAGEGAQQSALPNIPEIESGSAGQQARPRGNSAGTKALLRLGTLLPWLAREMEAGNDQNAALTQEVRHEVSGMRLVQYEIRSTVHDHSLQLKRVEEQLTRVRETLTTEASGTADLVETVKSTTKVVSMVGVGICVMLVALLGLVMFMVLHGR